MVNNFFLQNTLIMARETPSPFMANAILNFHFDYWNPSLIHIGADHRRAHIATIEPIKVVVRKSTF